MTILVKEALAYKLKTAIVEGRLSPGERVVEGVWAKTFGVAQASVREAINLLIAEGFLVKSAGRSARVPHYTEEDISRLYQVRAALEGLAAGLAAERRADLAEVETALKEMEEAAASGDLRTLVNQDLQFHLALARASGNPTLAEMIERLLRPLFTFVLLRVMARQESTKQWASDMPRHREIIYLIRESSPAVARQFMEFCTGQFVASAQAVWAPEGTSRRVPGRSDT